ncbi:MAG TPA: pseudouridine synthase [Geobacteraceae bacterium]|nr:pseudouridine synthase [Geobacteraceae bacterium]
MEPLTLLHRDENIAIFNKPAGLLVHRSWIDRLETRFALQMARDQLGCKVYPVHRLDKPTSGVLLFALSPGDASRLTSSFPEGEVGKRYLAVVRGIVPESGTIDHPLLEEQDRRDPYRQEGKGPQEAVTTYRRLGEVELPFSVGRYPTSRYSLVEAQPLTGRRHQIRRHLKHIFHPLVGDVNYGEGRHNRFFRDEMATSRLLLHAAELTFPHPESGTRVTVTAPLDRAFSALLGRLEWEKAVPAEWLGSDRQLPVTDNHAGTAPGTISI